MIYKYSSVKEVIGNVIRNTRLQDSSYILDLPEWIGEAMSFMRTNMDNVWVTTDVEQNYHIGSLPHGLVSIHGALYNGQRMNCSQRTRYPQSIHFTEWEHLPCCNDTYYIEMGYLKTPSICDGTIKIRHLSIPLDDEGFPLVPDNANYKQALYWHCRAMMIGAGYEDQVFKYDYCNAEYEKYAARAIAGINYPSTQLAGSRVPNITRFLPDSYVSYFGLGPSCGAPSVTGFKAQLPPSSVTYEIKG